jgi:hypothetical protein
MINFPSFSCEHNYEKLSQKKKDTCPMLTSKN